MSLTNKDYYDDVEKDSELYPELNREAGLLDQTTSIGGIYEEGVVLSTKGNLIKDWKMKGWEIKRYDTLSRTTIWGVSIIRLNKIIRLTLRGIHDYIDQFCPLNWALRHHITDISHPIPGVPCIPWIGNNESKLYNVYKSCEYDNLEYQELCGYYTPINNKQSARNGIWREITSSNYERVLSLSLYKDGLMKINKLYSHRESDGVERLLCVTKFDDYGYPQRMIVIVDPEMYIRYKRYYNKEPELHYRDTDEGVVKVYYSFNRDNIEGPVIIKLNNKIVEYYYMDFIIEDDYSQLVNVGIKIIEETTYFYDDQGKLIDYESYEHILSSFKSVIDVTNLNNNIMNIVYQYDKRTNYISQLKEAIKYYRIINGVTSHALTLLGKGY